MHNPLVSILIPNFNKAPFLRETLDSVLAQTYTHWECIVVDDHSTDNSWDILEKYASKDPRFKIYKRPMDRLPGGNAARNFAFEMSNGIYVNWLDSDDLINSINLNEKIIVFEKFPEIEFVLSDLYKFQGQIEDSKPFYNFREPENTENFYLNFGRNNNVFQTSMPLYKKSFLKSLEYLFDEDLIVIQDIEFHVRILLKSTNFKISVKSIVYWRENLGSITNSYSSSSFKDKYLKSYPGFKKIFLSIKNTRELNSEEVKFFKNVFNDRLLFLPFSSKYYWDLLFFGTKHNLFKGRFQGMKIMGIKFIKLLKKIDS